MAIFYGGVLSFDLSKGGSRRGRFLLLYLNLSLFLLDLDSFLSRSKCRREKADLSIFLLFSDFCKVTVTMERD